MYIWYEISFLNWQQHIFKLSLLWHVAIDLMGCSSALFFWYLSVWAKIEMLEYWGMWQGWRKNEGLMNKIRTSENLPILGGCLYTAIFIKGSVVHLIVRLFFIGETKQEGNSISYSDVLGHFSNHRPWVASSTKMSSRLFLSAFSRKENF